VPAAYLLDVNYYRLRYQLAAQQLGDALEHRPAADELTAAPVEPAGREDELRRTIADASARLERAEAGLPEVAWPDGARVAQHDAEDLSEVTAATIRTLKEAPRTRPLLRRRKPNATQQRLLRFLEETVQPCSELVAAGALAALGEPRKAEKYAAPIRASVLEDRPSPRPSHRAAYNLACYELAQYNGNGDEATAETVDIRSADRRFRVALRALQIALRRAPSHRQRIALIAWAEKDPALAPIAQLPQFHRLLERNRVPDTTVRLLADRGDA